MLETSSRTARSSSFKAEISWFFVGFLFDERDMLRPAEASWDGVMSGIPGCADLFFLRVFIESIEGVAE